MKKLLFACMFLLPVVSQAAFVDFNIAQGADVTVIQGSANGSLASLTDGVFLPRSTQWQTNTIWWSGLNTVLEVDLGSVYQIYAAKLQCDDNDSYAIDYLSTIDDQWYRLWSVPNFDAFGWGMQTRPNVDDDSQWQILAAPIDAQKVRVYATGGDNAYSVSELQFAVPEPVSLMMLGLGALALARRKVV